MIRRRRVSQIALIILTACVGTSYGQAPAKQSMPGDSVVIALVERLVKEEKTEALTVLVWDGHNMANISPSAYDQLHKKFKHFFEGEVGHMFILGPVTMTSPTVGVVRVTRFGDPSGCQYDVRQKAQSVTVKKRPCAIM